MLEPESIKTKPTKLSFQKIDQLPERDWTWDGRVGRYRYRDSGRLAPKKAIESLSRRWIAQIEKEATESVDKLITGSLTLEQWQRDNLERIRVTYSQELMLGSGGYDRTSPEQFLELGRDLKNNHYPRFRAFAIELTEGKLSEKQIKSRLAKYFRSANSSFSKGQIKSQLKAGITIGKRELGSCGISCEECIAYAGMGWLPLDKIIPIGVACSCGGNCCCRIETKHSDNPTSDYI